MNKKGVGFGMIITLVLTLISLTVLLAVSKSTIPTAATAYYDLAASFTNTTVYGADAVAFAATTPGLVGWFWIVGPFVLVILLVIGIFLKKHR